jgi:K+-sensing histidine kinase KdpD
MLRDHGPGVPEDELNAIFEPLFRDSRAPNNVDGHGLGLTIARRVIVAHLVLVYMPHKLFGGRSAGVRDRYSLRQKNQSVSATPNLPPWWLLHTR